MLFRCGGKVQEALNSHLNKTRQSPTRVRDREWTEEGRKKMAESAVGLLLTKLDNIITNEVNLLLGVEDQIRLLHDKFQFIKAFLKDADQKRREEENELVRVWVSQIREVAYDVEDVLDAFLLKIELQQSQRVGCICWLEHLITFPCHILTLHKLGRDMQKINSRLEGISDNRSQFKIDGITSSLSSSSVTLTRRYELEVDMVGFEDDVQTLTRQLTDPRVLRNAVISIVGMGGLGKTTLAHKVYSSQIVENHFNCRAWIFVSQKYNIRDLLKSLLKKIMNHQESEIAGMDEEDMKDKLHEYLKNKRYLVVIDDIWDITAWNGLKAAFPQGFTGSRVMLTTRKVNVAVHADPDSPPYELKLLSSEESWDLLCKKAFASRKCPAHLESLRGEIVKECGGLPLAIVVLGGLLRRKGESYNEWMKVLVHISNEFRQGEDQTQRILALSYDDLPHHLKPCFLYFASFPEYSVIHAEKLIWLWIAEGFIQQEKGRTLEEIAEEYLKELIQRCMIQLIEKNSYGGVQAVHVHDLLLDLALSESRDVNFLEIHNNIDVLPPPPNLRRLSMHNGMDGYISLNCSIPKLRSLLCTSFGLLVFLPNKFKFLESKFLRVIDLEGVQIDRLPKEIGDLIQLRYLGLRDTWLKELPSSIGNLCNLQTIDMRCTEISEVPDSFWEIRTLRHILTDHRLFSSGPKQNCSLNNLQTLEAVHSSIWVRSGILAKLRNLRRLHLLDIGDYEEKAVSIVLEYLELLVSLKLHGLSIPGKVFTFSNHRQLQEIIFYGQMGRHGLYLTLGNDYQLLPNLRSLCMAYSKLKQDNITMLAALPNLVSLQLCDDAYIEDVLVCPAGGFSRLQFLELRRLGNLMEWIVEDGAMPCLTHLTINRCQSLKMLPEGLRHMTALQKLELWSVKILVQRIQKDIGEDYPKIQHVPSIAVK